MALFYAPGGSKTSHCWLYRMTIYKGKGPRKEESEGEIRKNNDKVPCFKVVIKNAQNSLPIKCWLNNKRWKPLPVNLVK